jgi:hypothetical protein
MQMKMAKASEDDIQKVIKFFQFIEEFMEYGTHTTENDEFKEESIDLADEVFVHMLRKLWGRRFGPPGVDCSWSRVVFGCEILIKNCCDPDLDHLDWRSDLRGFLQAQNGKQITSL